MKWTLADAQHAGGVGQVTTLGSDLSVATATTHVGFNIGRINGRLLDLELSALEQNSSWILSPVRVCWPHIFSLPVLNRGAKFHIRFPAGKVARRRWNLKRPSRDGGHAHGVTKGRIRLKLHISQNVPGRCYSRPMAKCWRLISRRSKRRSRSKAEKRWRWAAFYP